MSVKACALLVFLLSVKCVLPQHVNWDECGKSKGCFSSPRGCNSDTSCKYLLTYQQRESHIIFEMSCNVDNPSETSYAAVGFSDDQRMGEDSVIECVHDIDTGEVNVYASYNIAGDKNNNRLNIAPPETGLVLLNSSNSDGIIYCRFTREKTVNHDHIYDLTKTWYLLMSNGPASSSNVHQHSLDPLPIRSPKRVNLLIVDIDGGETSTKALPIAHGCLMVIAWVLFVSFGKITARHYKKTLDEKVLDLAIWFHIHRTCMVTAWICFVSATVLIVTHVSGWVTRNGDSFTHSIVGIIAVSFGTLQPLIALCRCHPDSPNRHWFNWIHAAVGNIAHVTAITAIFFALLFLNASGTLPFYMIGIMIAFVVWLAFCMIVLEINKRIFQRVSEVSDASTSKTELADEQPESSKGSKLEKLMLGLCMAIFLILTLILVFSIIMKWGTT